MNITVARIFFLILMWWVCSLVAEPFFLIAGALCIWLSYYIAQRMQLLKDESIFNTFPKLPLYLLWLVKEIALAAISVSRIIWQIKPHITPRLFTVDTDLKSDLARSLYGNSITLTPGTICVDIHHKQVQVHALEKAGKADIGSRRMEKEIAKVAT